MIVQFFGQVFQLVRITMSLHVFRVLTVLSNFMSLAYLMSIHAISSFMSLNRSELGQSPVLCHYRLSSALSLFLHSVVCTQVWFNLLYSSSFEFV